MAQLVRRQEEALTSSDFDELSRELRLPAVESAFKKGENLYFHTYWIDFEQEPANRLEELILKLCRHVDCHGCIGVEWWLSVTDPNATPYWLLNPHFDREDISEAAEGPLIHPTVGSVFFLRSVPYGDLVIFDQVMKDGSLSPERPKDMDFVKPKENLYCIFDGRLLHGVMGRLWREMEESPIRIALGLNYWTRVPNAAYLGGSFDFLNKYGNG